MSHKTKVISRILMLLYIAALAYLCFWHFDSMPEVRQSLWGIPTDKIVHFLMFLPFPVLSYFCHGKVFGSAWKSMRFTILIFVLGCIIAACTELGQHYLTEYRVADPKDFTADTLALAVSSLVIFIISLIQINKGKE